MENWINKREELSSRFALKLHYDYYTVIFFVNNVSRSNILIPINHRKQVLEENIRMYDII